MDFYTDILKFKKAWRNITVWKVIQKNNQEIEYLFNFEYGQTYSSDFEIIAPYGYYKAFRVKKGFQSYKNKKLAKKQICITAIDCKIQKFMIPKGSLYAINEMGIIVSNQIKMIK